MYLSLNVLYANRRTCFILFQCWFSCEELVNWVQEVGRDNGYCIIKRRTKDTTGKGLPTKVTFMCDKGGVYRGKGESSSRKTGTRKSDCEFKLIGKKDLKNDVWSLRVVTDSHNHPPATTLRGHPYPMRLKPNEQEIVAEMTKDHALPFSILRRIQRDDPGNLSNLRNIYNERQKLRRAGVGQSSPVQILLTKLHEKNFGHSFDVNEKTQKLERLFFVHPTSRRMFRAFPQVLIIDSTYKTNKYNFPFLEMVGATSTGQTFSVACAALIRERQQDFVWALNCLKEVLTGCVLPRVIITDRDLGLVNACMKVFPDAAHQLCRFHILNNVTTHCKKSFRERDWTTFEQMWSELVWSSTPESYYTRREALRDFLFKTGRTSKYICL